MGCGYDEWDVELDSDFFNTEPDEYGRNLDKLNQIGLLEEKKYLKLKAKKSKREREDRKKSELNKLAELKKKYPNS